MGKCVYKSKIKKKFCVGSLDKKIEIKVRSLNAPDTGSFDYDLDFSDVKTVWANVTTVNGVTVFDSANVERKVSHVFIIRYYSGLTFTDWIKYSNKYYDVITVENIDEENSYLKIMANLRGDYTIPANKV